MQSLRILLLFFLSILPAAAQDARFSLLDIEVGDHPVVRALFFLNDSDGTSVPDLFTDDFRITENGLPASVLSLRCPPAVPPRQISSVLAIDVSGSMLNRQNIEIARAAANLWIDRIPLGYSECAVTSFDDFAWVNSDFTIDRDALHDAVAGLTPGGGTDYNAGLINAPGGAVRLAAGGKHHRVVVFLTDGVGGGDEEAIVQAALENDVTLYAVVLRMPATALLRNVVRRTGGLVFENVESQDQAEDIYDAILRVAQGEEPCEVTWRSDLACTGSRDLEIEIPIYDAGWKGAYTVPDSVVPALRVLPLGTSFGFVPAGETKDTTIRIEAFHAPVTISDMKTTSPLYRVISGNEQLPIVLEPGEYLEVTIRFTPVDSFFSYTRLEISSDACSGWAAFLSGGRPGIRSPGNTLRLLVPNGGEVYPVGGAVPIAWEGVLPGDTVLLEYSVDGGGKWTTITDQASGLRYEWTAPPSPSDRCLMRITQRTAGGESGVVQFTGATDRLQSADFSSDGGLAAVGGDDKRAYIFDVFTGNPVYEYPGHSGTIYSVEFNRDGDRLLVGTGAPESLLWEVGAVALQRLIGSSGSIFTTSSFDADGTQIVSHTTGGNVVVTDTAGILLSELKDPGFSGYTAHFSPDGALIASGGGSGDVLIWDVGTGTLLHRIQAHRGQVHSVQFSPDGGAVVSTASDSTVKVYDVLTGALLQSLREEFGVMFAKFSPDGDRLLIGGFSPTLHIRDVQTGDLVRKLSGHTRSVVSGDWSDDGSRILSASWDGTARVWDLNAVPNQEDLSDAFWSIVEPQVNLSDVDMGRVPVGRSRDSLVSAWVCNSGQISLSIDSISFSGSDFSPVSGLPPFTLAPGECRALEFRFTPSSAGQINDSVLLHAGAYVVAGTITGLGLPAGLEASIVDLGEVVVGERKDSLLTAALRNVSSIPLWISNTSMTGPDMDQFEILSGGGTFALDPGEVRVLQLRFAPSRKGRTSGSIEFEYDGVTNFFWGFPPVRVLLYGEGICPDIDNPLSGVRIPDLVEAAPGEDVSLPVLMDERDSLVVQGRKFTAVLRYNGSLLAPLDSAVFSVMAEDERVLVYNGTVSGMGDTLAVLRFLAALGDAESTPVVIESFLWDDGCGNVLNGLPGEFHLRNLCPEGGVRLFLASDSLFLKSVSANPASDRIVAEYGVIEQGQTELLLFSSDGAQISRIVDAELVPGRYRIPVDVSSLASGAYYLMLRTPTTSIVQPVLVGQ